MTNNKNLNPFDYTSPHQKVIESKLPKIQIFVLILSFITMLQGFATSGYTPAITTLAAEYNVSIDKIQDLVGYYLIGVGLGQIFWGPIMDRFGRKSTGIVAILLGIGVNFAVTLSPDYHSLAFVRVLQGFILSALGMFPSVMIKDSFSPRRFIIINSWLITLFLLAPAISPIFCGYIYIHFGWRMTFDIISILMFFSLLLFIIKIPETIDPEHKQSINPVKIAKNYLTILKDKQALFLLFINALFSVIIFLYVSLLPAILIYDYHVAPQNFGYYTIFITSMSIIGVQGNQFLIKKNFNPHNIWLTSAILQTLCTIVSYSFAFSEQLFGVNLLGPITIVIALCFMSFFSSFQIGNLMAIYLSRFPRITGTANALIMALRMLIPGVIVGFMTTLERHQGATLLVVCALIVAFNLCLTVFYRLFYGMNSKKQDS